MSAGGDGPTGSARRIAVTGAGGYIGGRLVQHLRAAGAHVVPVSRQPHGWLGPEAAVVDLLDDRDGLKRAVEGADAVVHLAGHDEVLAASDPERALTETVAMTRRVAAAARELGTSRVVYLSTVHVYGAALVPGAVITEAVVPAPLAAYASARLESEHLLEGTVPTDSSLVVLRLSNSVGPPVAPEVDRWTLLVNDLCRQAATTGRIVLRTPGLQARDWVALTDVCAAIEVSSDGVTVPAGTYNLASGRSTSVRDVATLVADVWADVTSERYPVEAPSATDQDAPVPYRVDVSRLAAHGVVLDTPLRDAVAETVAYCHRHRDELAALG